MTLAPGARLGVYEVRAPIGRGGMGEVYRALDTELKREVALKVLPPRLAGDPGRLARFRREAEILAALNHPNIAAIYGLAGEALVMELVPGQTLQDRLRAGPMGVEEALAIARQIIAAVEYAHERGIVHRDLKPANIKVTPSGEVKVLDFGLAKALDERMGSVEVHDGEIRGLSPDEIPTKTDGETQLGLVLGTAAYMSPEQAAGSLVDRRTDIFSFGVILYEMLSGTRAFAGASTAEIIAAVVRDAPDWAALPGETPGHVRHLLERCVRKDRRLRLQAIGEARIALDEPDPAVVRASASGPQVRRVTWAMAALALAALTALVAVRWPTTPPATPTIQATLLAPSGVDYAFQSASLPILSPDGTRVVFRAASGAGAAETAQLYVRRLDAPAAQPIAGTEGASGVIWSPDSRSIAYVVDDKLKRLDLEGGAALTVATLPGPLRGGTWNSAGVIVVGVNNRPTLLRIPAEGGVPVPIAKVTGEEVALRFPQFLPGGERFLYQATLGTPDGESHLRVGWLSRPDEPGRLVGSVGSNAVYADGHLFFLRDGTLVAQRLDETKLELSGRAIPIAGSVANYSSPTRTAAFSVASNGALIYQPGPPGQKRQLVWYSRQGKRLGTLGEPAEDLADLQLDADGGMALVSLRQGSNTDIWSIDTVQGIRTRRTTGPSLDNFPAISRDGTLYWHGGRAETILSKSLTGAGPGDVLLSVPKALPSPASVSPDGKWLLYFARLPGRDVDIYRLPLGTPGKAGELYLAGKGDQWLPQFSPDGAWVAYVSDETGRNEVYVASFPSGEHKRQISPNGGTSPRWRADGREILFGAPDSSLHATAVALREGALVAGRTQQLFGNPRFAFFDVAQDGRILIVESVDGDETAPAPLSLIHNWRGLLRR